ncbi:hypothetical protein BofuT4_uP022720.1 [Botrytis cinerea T4]|uniref:Uncharacterized protein n=1 Tax=Botryotinia fuckeliana (strain T4) TaxID=999810 RepID=G2YGX0_BOTF4|nr:hypothetical protein BofuT4_uP022720.1 [Botrytis cinerea T4]
MTTPPIRELVKKQMASLESERKKNFNFTRSLIVTDYL